MGWSQYRGEHVKVWGRGDGEGGQHGVRRGVFWV